MNLSILARCGLFRGIETAELSPLLRRLHACPREFDKFQPIYRVGDTAHALCILLSGGVNIERCDAWGHKTLLDRITPGSVFAETYACVPGTPMMVSAVADEPSEVLFLPSETLLSSAAQDSAHSVLLRNLLDVTAQKNLLLTRKIFHTSPKSMRGKLLSYLSAQAVQHGSDTFDIPFDRQQLADYLGVDRSAMCSELSAMRRDGLIRCEKRRVEICEMPVF